MNVIIMSVLVGIGGMGLGGLLGALLGQRSEKMISVLLSFAGGIMTGIVFFELLPESMEYGGMGITVIGLAAGALMVMLLNGVLDKRSPFHQSQAQPESKLHENYTAFFHADGMIAGKKNMLRAGMVILFAIGLHNVPEGLALGAAGSHDISLSYTLALIIALHNLPEGMAVSAPLISGGLSKQKTVLLATLTGVPTVLGALIGAMLGGISPTAVALSFAFAGGAMLYVVFGEILPQSIVTHKDRAPIAFLFIGIILGLLLTAL